LAELGGTSDEGFPGGVGDDGVRLAALAAGGVVDDVAEVLLDGERLTGDGGLVDGDERVVAVVLGQVLVVVVALLLVAVLLVAGVALAELVLGAELLVDLEVVGALVVADQAGISRDSATFLNDDLYYKSV
jgi:hypothetical protein